MTREGLETSEDRTLCSRIVSEYLEMPGLIVTIPQASRLWHIDAATCTRLLNALSTSGFLRRSGDSYVRANAGREAA